MENLAELVNHPGSVLVCIYLLSYLFKGSALKYVLMISPVVSFFLVVQNLSYTDIEFFYISALLVSLFCGIIFAYSGQVRDKDNARLALLYFGAGISIVMSSNLFLIFTLFELMLIAATFMIFNGGNRLSSNAGAAYFKLHIFAGVLFLIGTITHYSMYGELVLSGHDFLDFSSTNNKILSYSILCALLVNIATPPFSYWLVEGYSATTPAGSVFLSVVTTKISLLVMMKMFLGLECLVYIGIFLGVYGLIYASLESNMRRIINYGIISQIGVVLIAIGIGEKDLTHYMVISEIVYIALAMMCVCSVVLSLRVKRYFQIPNNIKFSPVLFVCSVVAFCSFSSFPFTPGYVSKYLLYKSSFVLSNQWLGYVISGLTAGMAFVIGIRLPVFIFMKKFYHKQSSEGRPYVMTTLRAIALKILSLAVMVLGVFPELIISKKVEMFDSTFFNQLSLLLGALVSFSLLWKFLVVRKKYTLLDFDWFFRYMLKHIYGYCRNIILNAYYYFSDHGNILFRRKIGNFVMHHFGVNGRFVSISSQKNVVLMLLFLILLMILSF